MPHPFTLAPEEFWSGDRTLLTWPTVALLNSRQGRYPVGGEAWVQATVRAALESAGRECVLLAGLGMATWEIGIWAAAEALGGVAVLQPLKEGLGANQAHEAAQALIADLGLTHQPILVIPWLVPTGANERDLWHARDRWILEQAGELLPVSIRPGGSLEAALEQEGVRGKVDRRFLVEYAPRKHHFPPPPEPDRVKQALAGWSWEHATHWTRTAHGPWPGESRTDYYTALAASGERYPRDAEATLRRILAEGRLRASAWRMPMNRPMVSFSSLPPWEMVPRMRWRKRYLRPSFEPWGIAIHHTALAQFGARPVRYGGPEERTALPPLDRLYFQLHSERNGEWEAEQEWRFRGDLELPPGGSDQLRVLVPTPEARERLQPTTPFEVISLTR